MEKEITDSAIDFSGGVLINELAAWMDGGSITFYCETNDNKGLEIELVQRVQLMKRDSQRFPGSLYLNRELVGIRSSLEEKILIGLNQAIFNDKLKVTDLDKEILRNSIDYIRSDEFIEIARIVGRIKTSHNTRL